MYIKKYWGNYIGGTDDSLSLLDYLADKKKAELDLSEIFSEVGLDKLNGDYTQTRAALGFTHSNGFCMDFYYAIDLVTDLAALLLECKKNGGIHLVELAGHSAPDFVVRIIASPDDMKSINQALMNFSEDPLAYDLCEMVPEDDMLEIAEICRQLREELELETKGQHQ